MELGCLPDFTVDIPATKESGSLLHLTCQHTPSVSVNRVETAVIQYNSAHEPGAGETSIERRSEQELQIDLQGVQTNPGTNGNHAQDQVNAAGNEDKIQRFVYQDTSCIFVPPCPLSKQLIRGCVQIVFPFQSLFAVSLKDNFASFDACSTHCRHLTGCLPQISLRFAVIHQNNRLH